jgi:plasmid maintenance system antidote protein VapI
MKNTSGNTHNEKYTDNAFRMRVSEYIQAAYMEPLGLSIEDVAEAAGVNGTREYFYDYDVPMTVEMGLALAKVFSCSHNFFLLMESAYLIEKKSPCENANVLHATS